MCFNQTEVGRIGHLNGGGPLINIKDELNSI